MSYMTMQFQSLWSGKNKATLRTRQRVAHVKIDVIIEIRFGGKLLSTAYKIRILIQEKDTVVECETTILKNVSKKAICE